MNIVNQASTRKIINASTMKDIATEFEVNHLTDVNNEIGNDPVIQVETNSLKDAEKPYLVNKNVNPGNKSVSKDYYSVLVAAYSSFHIPKDFLPEGSVSQKPTSWLRTQTCSRK